ncbi:hypothetical protein LPJ61_005858, partial [Coemansia biformis]
MQSAVPCDEQSRSEFGMAAVDPSRVAKGFGEDQLHLVVNAINTASLGLLEIVNYNMATILLRGIDVPFHSQQLLDGMPEFCEALHTKFNCGMVSPDVLYRRYIPNLTAVPFEVSREYFEHMLELTGSPVMRRALDVWSDVQLEDAAEKARLAVELLVELLTYQFASPVQWIKTQDCLIHGAEVERLVEIGPSPVLCGMAAKTLQGPQPEDRQVSLLHFERDQDEIYYRHIHEEGEATVAQAPAAASLPETPAEQPRVEPSPPVSQSSASPGAGEPIAEVPLQAFDVAHAVVAFKLKQPLGGISAQQTIKTLVAGKSTLQNEI